MIKVSMSTTPVDETAKITVTRQWLKGTEWKDSGQEIVDTVTAVDSRELTVQPGERLSIIVEPSKVIVFDTEQNTVRLEDPLSAETQERRQREQSEREEAEKAVVEDKKKRFQSAERLDREARERAAKTETPVEAVPNVPPLPEELEARDRAKHEAEHPPGPFPSSGNNKVPPKGGAKDSKEVKAG
jgi:hypothetical protein